MEFTILGPVELQIDARTVPLGGPRQRALFALLLLHANEPVSRDQLIEGLWGEQAPATAQRSLDSYVSRLRLVLGADRIERRAPGYAIVVGPGELDLDRFEELLAQGRTSLADGEADAAAKALRAALALWRGRALADLLYEPFAAWESERLEERRLLALEARLEADIALGQGPELIPELERLIQEHPFRERLLGHLMLSLYRAGRQSEALAAFQASRRRLTEELGLEPSSQLRELERQILEHDTSLDPRHRKTKGFVPRGRRRLAVIAAVGAVAAAGATLALSLLLGTSGTTQPGNQSAAGSQLVRLDAGSGRIGATTAVDAAPAAIADGNGSLWIADTSRNAVLRVDPGSGRVVDRIPLSKQPGSVVVGGGAVWVANTTDGSVTRIDAVTDNVTQVIRLGGSPPSLAYGRQTLWVTDPLDDALLRIDPASGSVQQTVTLAAAPTTVTVGDGAVWVTSYDTGTVTEIDARSNSPVETVHVGQGPTAMAFGAGFVWVANDLDGTVSMIDPKTASVVATIPTGSSPAALAFAGGSLFVANRFSGTVSRIDPARPSEARAFTVGGEPTSLAAVGNVVWVGTQPAGQHHGGKLAILLSRRFLSIDPQVDYELPAAQFLGLVNDGLVAYNHTAGPGGLQLVPDLALSIPAPTDEGKRYTFQLRSGIKYSDGRPVKASDFTRAMTRLFRVSSPGTTFFAGVIGGTACTARPARCGPLPGVITNDSARTVTFQLTAPDPDFLLKLAIGFVVPIPPGTPMLDVGSHPIPGTGPYKFGRVGQREISFVRNPRFQEWSHAAQPDGNPDEIVWRFGLSPDQEIRAVAKGHGDWTGDPPQDLNAVARRYAPELRSNAFPTVLFVQINTRRPPFNDVRVRRALNFAIDRGAIAKAYGAVANTPTCQVLPPGIPGYQRYCPYTLDPRADGRWSSPNLPLARALVAASGTRGTHVTIRTVSDAGTAEPAVPHLAQALRLLGYPTTVRVVTTNQEAHQTPNDRQTTQLEPVGYGPDYPSPAEIFSLFLACNGTWTLGRYCDPQLDREIQRAQTLRLGSPRRSATLWAHLDREVVDRAAWIPLTNQRIVDFVSPRLRNYQFSPIYHFLPAQAWVR